MKNLIIAISLLVSFNVKAHDTVENSESILAATLIEMDINHEYLKDHTIGGKVLINKTADTITLQLDQNWFCPEGAACATVMPAPRMIELPIVAQYSDWCGSTTYEAVLDKTPVDGLRETLVVRDYSQITCRIAVPYQTDITYNTYNPWTNQSVTSGFTGDTLVLLPTFFN